MSMPISSIDVHPVRRRHGLALLSFRTRMGLGITLTAISFSILLSWFISLSSKNTIEHHNGDFVEQIAAQLSYNLENQLSNYFSLLQVFSQQPALQDITDPANRRLLLNNLQKTQPHYAWLGIVDNYGQVLVSTLPNFKPIIPVDLATTTTATLTPVHNNPALTSLLHPTENHIPAQPFITMAIPLANTHHQWLVAELDWQWAQELRNQVLQSSNHNQQMDVFVLSAQGDVVLAPTENERHLNLRDLQSYQLAPNYPHSHIIENWPDQENYLTGFARSQNRKPLLKWTVLVRESTESAFADTNALQRQILWSGGLLGFFSGVLAWLIAGRITKPITAIANAAHSIEKGASGVVVLPLIAGHDEVARLSQAINGMYERLAEQNQQLLRFNHELERHVNARTIELQNTNARLVHEIEERKLLARALEQANQELHRLTLTDGLTNIANRRSFDEHLNKEWQRAIREQKPLSIALMDVDYFKRYNDYYGHPQGDVCLQHIAQILTKVLKRVPDLAARYGGEEFALILPNTDADGAKRIAEKIQAELAASTLEHNKSLVSEWVTLSIGIATIVPHPYLSPSELLRAADEHLYLAKQQGRNRVISG